MKNVRKFENFDKPQTKSQKRLINEGRDAAVPYILDEIDQIIQKFKSQKTGQVTKLFSENEQQTLGFISNILKVLDDKGHKFDQETFETYVKEYVESMKRFGDWYKPSALTRALGLDVFTGYNRSHYKFNESKR